MVPQIPKRLGRAAGKTSVTSLLTMFVVTSVIMGVLVSGLVIPFAAGVGQGVHTSTTLLTQTTTDLIDPVLEQTSVMKAADGSVIAYFYNENRTSVPLTQISPFMQKAIIAIEDERFYTHGAVDPRGLIRAVVNNESGGAKQGASTITQQYVKNAELERAVAAGDKDAAKAAVADTIQRKISDIRSSAALEQRLSKQDILTRYLNIVFFDDNTYGVQAAARRYFNVSAARLTLPQAATLAGMAQNAIANNPTKHPETSTARRNLVLQNMLRLKMITQVEYDAAIAKPIKVTGKELPSGCVNAKASDGFFCQYVVQKIMTDPAYAALGKTQKARLQAVKSGGLVIQTTLDPTTQAAAYEAVNNAIPRKDSSGLATAAVTVEPGSGKVISMAQDRTFSIVAGKGRTAINFSVDHDLGGGSGFQTGSSFKPFTLATWLSDGHGLNDTVNATPRTFQYSEFEACGDKLGNNDPYAPGNSEGHEGGQMSVEKATADSVNVAYVEMESQLDMCDIVKTAKSMGVHLGAVRNSACTHKDTTQLPNCLPALTLGIEDIAPITMAAAYATFATGGTFCKPTPVNAISIPTAGGITRKKVKVPGALCSDALEPDVASDVNTALKQVLTNGTAAKVGPLSGYPSAGKTGTTNGSTDTWFVGYTAQRSTAVWVGDPGSGSGRKSQTNITINGVYHNQVFGADIAAPIWKDLMKKAMEDLSPEDLP